MSKKILGTKNISEFDYYCRSETDWRLNASCKNSKTSIFFGSPKSRDIVSAKAICATCPVSPQCLMDALKYQYYGVWGNTTEKERVYITKKICGNDLTDLTLDNCRDIVKLF